MKQHQSILVQVFAVLLILACTESSDMLFQEDVDYGVAFSHGNTSNKLPFHHAPQPRTSTKDNDGSSSSSTDSKSSTKSSDSSTKSSDNNKSSDTTTKSSSKEDSKSTGSSSDTDSSNDSDNSDSDSYDSNR